MSEGQFFDIVGTDSVERPRSHPPVASTEIAQVSETPASMITPTGERRWAASYDTFWGATQTYDELPAGLYRCSSSPNIGPVLIRQRVDTDKLLQLPDDAAESIIAEFQQFWEIADEFRSRGFMHKRGFLLWGPPGSGKTSCLQLLIKKLIDGYSGIVLFVDNPQIAAQCLSMARAIEPKRPMIAVLEDLDALVHNHGEHEFLALLDGEAQVDSIVFLATSNYPERLDRRFVDRPSRFDTIKYVGMPSSEARAAYFRAKEPDIGSEELEAWVAATDGLSIAHLKELIIAVRCFKQPLDKVAERLAKMHGRKPSSEETPDSRVVGFAPRRKVKEDW